MFNGALSSGDKCNGALSPGGDKCNGDICNGASSVIYNGVKSKSLVSSVEERQIGNVLLRIVHHESDHCKEFAVVSLSFNIYRWLTGVLGLVCIGYYMQLHLQVRLPVHLYCVRQKHPWLPFNMLTNQYQFNLWNVNQGCIVTICM